MEAGKMKAIESCIIKMIDFAYAVKLDANGTIARTMSDEIRRYGEKALGLLSGKDN